MIDVNNISYRDSAARVVKRGHTYSRYIFNEYKKEYDHLMDSGLYLELIECGLLIKHKEIALDSDDPNVYKLLYPEQIPFQAYPFEWTYSQWRKAILSYLKINNIALKYGMILKDASPFNFYLIGGKAVMFDTSSFIFFKENDNWIAYRQFCEEFLSPVALMYYNGADWSKLTIANIRGMQLDFVSKQLPLKSWFNLTVLLNVHLHSKFIGKNKLEVQSKVKKAGFTLSKIKVLLKIIYDCINGWRIPYYSRDHWFKYYENDIESHEYLVDKEIIIRNWLAKTRPRTILDLGANTGKFSFIAAEYTEKVIALESVQKCIDEIENNIYIKNTDKIFTVLGNVAEPVPGLGLFNGETEDIYKRCNSELVMGLGLIHHLFITNKLNYKQIVDLFIKFTSKYLIVEFINLNDSKLQLIAFNSNFDLSNYNIDLFFNVLIEHFIILEQRQLLDSERIILFLEKK